MSTSNNIDFILNNARKYMHGKTEGNWHDYERYKAMVGDVEDLTTDEYAYFIGNLVKILGL